MTTYIVTFEVGNARAKLIARLKAFPGYCPINANCWAIQSPQTPKEICDALKLEVEGKDRIFVIRSGTQAAWINTYGEDNSTWLKNNL